MSKIEPSFFANYEGFRQQLGGVPQAGFVPSQAFRNQVAAAQPSLAFVVNAYPTGQAPTSDPNVDSPIRTQDGAAALRSVRTAVGNALMRDAQEQEKIGTVNCLVTDGADIYALTNGHVIVSEDEDLFDFDEVGHRKQIAIASSTAQRSVVFSEAYSDWPGIRTFLTADVGMSAEDLGSG